MHMGTRYTSMDDVSHRLVMGNSLTTLPGGTDISRDKHGKECGMVEEKRRTLLEKRHSFSFVRLIV